MEKNNFSTFILSFLFLSFSYVKAEIPAGYYDAADGKAEAELKTAMHQIIRNFINLDFDGFSAMYWGENYFKKCDWNPAGYYWDMYSSEQRSTYNSSQMAREHCMPRSWWGTSTDYGRANGDLNNLFPADFTANGKKSNLPLGETTNASWTNEVVKIGTNSYLGYTGNIFEPADEYKGDFARTYLYMVTSLEDYSARWEDDGLSMLNNETYPVFKDWAIDMLLDWCRQDPVSQKEIDRNDSVFSLQQNRNPFIDIPDLAEYIWGNKKSQTLTIENKTTTPTLITPTAGVSINFGDVLTTSNKTRSIPIKGHFFNSTFTIDLLENTSGFFSVENELTASQINEAGGYFLPIVYNPTSEGIHTAKLRINNTDLNEPVLVQLQGNAVYKLEVDPVEPTDEMDVVLFYTGPWATANLPENFTTNVKSGPYANGDFSFRNNNEYLTVAFNEEAEFIQFSIYPRNAWGTNDNHLYVYEGTNANSFDNAPIADFDNAFMVTGDSYNNTPKIQLKKSTRAIKIQYKKVSQNVGINNLIVANNRVASHIAATEENTPSIFSSDNILYINNLETESEITIYNALGQILKTQKTNSENIEIHGIPKGFVLIKINNRTVKTIIR